MSRLAPARLAAARTAAGLAVVVLAGCRAPTTTAFDLVTGFAEAEVRSDALDLGLLAADPGFTRCGWAPPEPGEDGTGLLAWAEDGRSRLALPFHSTGDKVLSLRGRSHESLGASLRLRLSLDGKPLSAIDLTPREPEFRIVLSAAAQLRGDNVLLLESSRRREPPPGDPDRRRLVAAAADHGEELLDHGGTEHAKTLYQELVRVPLVVRLPGGRSAGRRLGEPVQQTDLLPTLVRLGGLPVPGSLQGRDLAPHWTQLRALGYVE